MTLTEFIRQHAALKRQLEELNPVSFDISDSISLRDLSYLKQHFPELASAYASDEAGVVTRLTLDQLRIRQLEQTVKALQDRMRSMDSSKDKLQYLNVLTPAQAAQAAAQLRQS